MKEIALHWIGQYGYAGIFSLLIFGIVGLPVPDEWLLTFSGFALFAYTGAFCWVAVFITLGYFLGEEWNRVVESLDKAKFVIIGLAAVAGIAWFAYLRRRSVRL